jgi:N-acetylglucosamine-6-phosphate deacetylase
MSDLKYGAHDVNTLRDAKKGITDLESVYGNLDNHNKAISLITVAPDVEGMLDAIPELAKRVPCVSLGHTAALTTVAEEGVRRGAKMVTHLFNAMNQFHHRDPGCIGLLGSSLERPFYGIICDGVHVHPNSVKIAYYSHPKGACLVTDAMAAAGLAEGSYTLGKMNVEVKGKKITIAGTDTIAGSNVKMYECVQNFRKFTGCTTVEAIEAATLHPAQVLGIENRKGTLNNGADADFLFLDDDLNLLRLFINGEEAQL